MSPRIFIPRDAGALCVGAEDVATILRKAAVRRGLAVEVVRTGSRGMYWLEPLVEVARPEGRIGYGPVKASDIESLLDSFMLEGGEHPLRLGLVEEIPFLKRQTRLTFARCGVVMPIQLAGNIKYGGLFETAFGISLGELVDDIGGGTRSGRLPGSTFLEKNGTFTNAERRIQPVRKVMAPKNGYEDWQVTELLSNALGYPMHYNHPSEIMDEIAQLTPTFAGVSFKKLDELGSVQWPCNEKAPEGTPVMHINGFVRGKGKFVITEYVATDERTGPRYPLLLTTGRILSQYNVGAQTRRTANVIWHEEDRLEVHPHDAEQRGIRDGDWVKLASRAGETTLRAQITERVGPGVVYTTFHHPHTQVNVVTTEFSDWATNCPEYKVTAVQVMPSNGPSEWQEEYEELTRQSRRIAEPAVIAAE